MIIGLGIDLVLIEKIAKSVERDAFKLKVFTTAEIEICEATANSAERYAGKFAAKEALMKAIGKGIRQEVWFSQIEVLNLETGAPAILTSGEAEKALSSLGVDRVHLSISHTEGMAVAVVVLESSSN
jgi:holo-[acyl-carrier protein] synthase